MLGDYLYLTGNWQNQGTILVSQGNLVLGGQFTTAGMGNIVRTGGSIIIAGNLDNSNNTFNVNANAGNVSVSNYVLTNNAVGNISGGTIAVAAPYTLSVSAASVQNVSLSGTMISNGGEIRNFNFLPVHKSPTLPAFLLGLEQFTSISQAINGGIVAADGLVGSNLSSGTWKVYDNSSIIFGNSQTFKENAANVLLDGANSSFAAFNTLLQNDGTLAIRDGRLFNASGAFINNGELSVGAGTVFSVTGSLTEGPASIFDITLASGTPFQLFATGNISLGGNLSIEFAPGYIPPLNFPFSIIIGTYITGSFNSVTSSPLPSNEQFQVLYSPNQVLLKVVSVPEPTSAVFLLLNTGNLLCRRRNRNRQISLGTSKR